MKGLAWVVPSYRIYHLSELVYDAMKAFCVSALIQATMAPSS
jgi:hypothetical protein